jgi:hypothetical protein
MNLAWILATHPDETLRDPQAALDLAGEFSGTVTDWMRMDIEAAALAGLGRTVEAGQKLEAALAEQGIPDDFRKNLKARQQLYRVGKSYTAGWDEFVPQ